jgi:choline dehydrogenase
LAAQLKSRQTERKMVDQDLQADVVIVGAGSAGAVLASRLSEDPKLQVILIEAGKASSYPWLNIPIGYFKTVGHPEFDWGFQTDPEPEMAGRRLPWPRGKGLGGTSLINGMLYLRGHRRDYDEWRSMGNQGWGWDEVLPYFQRAMHAEHPKGEADGQGGPFWISDLPRDDLSDAFIEAAGLCGIARTQDFNQGDNKGAGYFRMNTRNGVRMSTGKAYLDPVRDRKNLRVISGAHAMHIVTEGRRACGVKVLRNGSLQTVRARHEMVLSAGAIQTPQLLQISGIGPANVLSRCGVEVIHDMPGVGENLQDHLQVRPSYRCQNVVTLNDIANSKLRSAIEFLRYQTTRQGALRNGVYRAGAFFSAGKGADPAWPNAQIHFGLVSFDRPHQPPHPFPGITLSACILRPQSRGRISIASNDPLQAPSIQAGYLSAEADRNLAIDLVRKMREIASAQPMSKFIVEEHEPGRAMQSDAEILDWVRRRAGSIFHPVGTCAMGPQADAMAVVDHRLRVHGMTGLRVVDGSVMPRIVSGNTNAPIIMMAERAADLIAQDLQG